VHVDAAAVLDEADFSTSVHEEAPPQPCGSDRFGQRLLADFDSRKLHFRFLAEIRQEAEQPGQAFLARIEQLIDEVGFDADGAAQEMGDEQFGEGRLAMDRRGDCRSFQPHDGGVRRGVAQRLARKTGLAKELIAATNGDDCFFAVLRNDGELYLAGQDACQSAFR
jgi:hypothetical protein